MAATVAAVQRDLDEACVAIERAQRRLARVVGLRSFERELRLTPLQQRLLATLRPEPHADTPRVDVVDTIDRDDGQPARALATAAERARVHQRLLDVFSDDRPLRGSQARHLSAVQDGGDAILIGATGSGKSYTMFAP